MCTTNRLTAALAAVACCAALAEAGPSASPSGRRPQTAASPERSRILSITTQQTPEGLAVTIRASGRIVAGPIGEAQNPPRLFIDLPGVVPGAEMALSAGQGPLLRLRAAVNSLDPLVTRVVLDLRARAAYHYHLEPGTTNDNELTVVLASPPATESVTRGSSAASMSAKSTSVPAGGTSSSKAVATQARRPVTAAARASQALAAPAASAPAGVQPSPSAEAQSGELASAAIDFPDAIVVNVTAEATRAQPIPPPTTPMSTQVPMTMAPKPTIPMGPRPSGRASFYSNASTVKSGVGDPFASEEFISTVTYQLPDREDDGLEYGLDMRHSGTTVQGRAQRFSIYDGFVGARFNEGTMRVRAGHMWLNDLGALGSVAGGLFEVRQSPTVVSPVGRWRVGVFGGLEPQVYDTGYADNVRKLGTYFGIDAARNRRHVVGYVNVRNASLTERSVLTFTNFVPVGGKVFVYQAAEYDLSGPGGQGNAGLTYLFANGRYTPTSRFELQGTYNRGRSIDARGISEDVLNGRPVSLRQVEGLLYESIGGRATVEVLRRVRVYVGYSQDRNNREDAATGRLLVGGYASNIANTGFDVTVSDSRIDRPTGNYHSSYVSIGKQLGRRVYVSGDYTTSLSLVRFSRSDGILIEVRPHTTRFGGTSTINLGRVVSLLFTAERTHDDDVHELRVLSGITYRFQ